ncbi:MAG: DNA-binding MarR family transcriptional regulator [Bacteroidia bacterium]|jgi:DNA-binding MarR family transcriptional regulator
MLNFQLTQVEVSQHIRDGFEDTGLTYQQYNVLKIVAEAKKGKDVTINYIKDRLVEKDADISRLIDRLKESGYVNKTPKPTDKRHTIIELTEFGKSELNNLKERVHFLDEVFFNLNSTEVKQLNMLLNKIRKA